MKNTNLENAHQQKAAWVGTWIALRSYGATGSTPRARRVSLMAKPGTRQ